jgi:probable HAF family extracellular repeat protein
MKTLRLLLWVGFYFGFASLASGQEYTIKPPPTLGGSRLYSQPYGFSDLDQIVGASGLVKGINVSHAYLWSKKGGIQDLGTLGGTNSAAMVINDSGQIAGGSQISGDATEHAFLWTSSGGMQDLGVFPGDDISMVSGLNNLGQVVGTSWLTTDVGTQQAFLWAPSTGMAELTSLGGKQSVANGISDAGQVVGWFYPGDGFLHAFVWTANGGVQDLGQNSGAIGVNNLGQVVGSASFASGLHAFLWTSQTGLQDLGSLGGISVGNAINQNGQVVGFFRPLSVDTARAFIWTPKNGMQDLNQLIVGKLSKPLVGATTISAAGQILAYQSNNISFVLTPKMTIAVTSSADPSVVGNAVTFTATVGHAIQGPPPDGEKVRFKDGKVVLGTGTLKNGIATFTTLKLNAGTHMVVAVYGGDVVYASSTSSIITQVVNQ